MTKAITDAKDSITGAKDSNFIVSPPMVQFMDYQVNGVYEI